MAERWHARLEQVLNHSPDGTPAAGSVRLPPRFRADQHHRRRAERGDWRRHRVAAAANRAAAGRPPRRYRPRHRPRAGARLSVRHRRLSWRAAPGRAEPKRLPLWFIEGMAEYLSIGPVDANTAMWLRDAVPQDKLPTVEDLDNPEYFPYRWGQAFWAYVAGRWGDRVGRADADASALRRAASTVAIERVLGIKQEELSDGLASGHPPRPTSRSSRRPRR